MHICLIRHSPDNQTMSLRGANWKCLEPRGLDRSLHVIYGQMKDTTKLVNVSPSEFTGCIFSRGSYCSPILRISSAKTWIKEFIYHGDRAKWSSEAPNLTLESRSHSFSLFVQMAMQPFSLFTAIFIDFTGERYRELIRFVTSFINN